MSWFLIILMVLIFVIFGLSCVIIIVWITMGSPVISGSSLDLGSPLFQNPPTTVAIQDIATQNKDVRVLVADTPSGYILTTKPENSLKLGKHGQSGQDGQDGNRLVQTLFIGGLPAVSRTTTFAQASLSSSHGPVDVHEDAGKEDIVQWYQNIAHTNNLPLTPDVQLANGDDIRGMLDKETRMSKFRLTTQPSVTEDAAPGTYGDLQRAHLLPALIAEQNRRELIALKSRDPRHFHLLIRGGVSMCASSSTLQLPVELVVPDEYALSLKSANDLYVRWEIHDIPDTLEMKLIWSSEPLPMQDMVLNRQLLTVDTQLQCSTVQNLLMRIKLVDATPGKRHHDILCSAFFNPTCLINNGPTCFGRDLKHAWHIYRQINPQV